MSNPIIATEELTKYYHLKGAGFSSRVGICHALEKVTFDIMSGEVFGLVGESGCGKSTLGRAVLRLEEPTSGKVFFEGRNIGDFNKERLKKFRRQAQIIYQDPYSALNPRKKVLRIIEEALEIHKIGTSAERRSQVLELLETVGLLPEHAKRYPHEFSGGQRQRIVIARALALRPRLILADEPVSALDVSIQAQVINLLKGLQEKFGLTYLFISHDLSVVEHLADRVGVMYLGRLVELSPKADFYANPLHPYSEALLSAAPTPDPTLQRKRIILEGDVPSPINPPKGCPFHPRCPRCMDICKKERPLFKNVGDNRKVACHLH